MELTQTLEELAKILEWNTIDIILFTLLSYIFVAVYKIIKNTYEDIQSKKMDGQLEVLKTYIDLQLFIEKIDFKSDWELTDYEAFEYSLKINRLSIEYSIFNELIENVQLKDNNTIKYIIENRIKDLYLSTNEQKDYSKNINYINNWLLSIGQMFVPIVLTFSFLLISSIVLLILINQPSQLQSVLTLIVIITGMAILAVFASPLKKYRYLLAWAAFALILNILLIFIDATYFYILFTTYTFVLIKLFYEISKMQSKPEILKK